MKWLFVVLLIINLALFGWMLIREDSPDRPEAAVASEKPPSLRLLAEKQQEKDKQAGKEEEAVTIAAWEAEEKAKKEAQEMAQQPEPEPEPEFLYAQNSIEPLLEWAVRTTERCGILGPFREDQTAKSVEEILENAGIEVWVRENSERIKIGNWVVIPPLENSEQVQEKIQELVDAGITDIWYIRSGELKNFISLGVFCEEENARNYSRSVAAKGFNTELRPRFLNKQLYRLGFRIENSEPVINSMWQQIELQYPQYKLNTIPCEQIARQE